MDKVLRVGDRMRFSVELVDTLKKDEDRTILVEVIDIDEDHTNGTKCITLCNAE